MSEPLWPEALTQPYDDDVIAQELVRRNGEMTLTEVGALFGVSREAVRLIEAEALRKIAETCAREGIPLRELHEGLGEAAGTVWPDWGG